MIRAAFREVAPELAQTNQIAERLGRAADAHIEIVTVTTQGDVSRASLQTIGGTGVFAAALRAIKRGALALAGASVALLVIAWLLIYVCVFLPRGMVG